MEDKSSEDVKKHTGDCMGAQAQDLEEAVSPNSRIQAHSPNWGIKLGGDFGTEIWGKTRLSR